MINTYKIFIKNFKTIYYEIIIDLDSTKHILPIIGENGIGKTNIIEAIEWLINPNSEKVDFNDIKTKKFDGDFINKNEETSVCFIKKINDNIIQKIKKIYEDYKNEFGLSLSFPKLDYLKSYFVILQRSDKDLSVINNFRDFKDSKNNEYKNIYSFIVNDFLKKIIEKKESSGEKNFKDFILLDNSIQKFIDINYEYIEKIESIKKHNTSILESIKERMGNEEDDCDNNECTNSNYCQEPKHYEEYDEIKDDINYNEQNYIDTLNIEKFLNKINDLFEVKHFLHSEYIENASKENKLKYKYTIPEIKKPENKILYDFLDSLASLASKINTYEAAMKESDEDKRLKKKNEIRKSLEKISKDQIKDIFNNFDIYAKPEFNFEEDKIVMQVTDNKNYTIGSHSIDMNSSGYKAFFEFIIILHGIILNAKNYPNKLFFILADEPDKNLHIRLQSNMIYYFEKLLEKYNNIFLLYPVHSPYLINPQNSSILLTYKDIKNEYKGSTMVKELKTDILISESPWEELNSFDEIKSIVTIFEAIGIIEKKEDNSQKYNLRNAINKISFQNKKIVLINSELSQKQVEEYEDDMNYYNLIKMLLNDKYDLVELESKLIEKYEKDIEKIDIEHVRNKNILKTKIDDCIKEHKYLYIEKK